MVNPVYYILVNNVGRLVIHIHTMNSYTATIKNFFGGCTTVSITAYSYNDALVIAASQYGDRVIYVQN